MKKKDDGLEMCIAALRWLAPPFICIGGKPVPLVHTPHEIF